MLKHLTLKDFVIVTQLDVAFDAGFCVLTGETGAGKSILIDALQLALGARADALVVREGAPRAEVSAEFDCPAALQPWLQASGFDADVHLLLRRVVDAQGKSRAFINGSPATATQLREVADALVDIHGQHAWQGLTRPASVRALLDELAGVDARALAASHATWQQAEARLAQSRQQQSDRDDERERLRWQISELNTLAPADDEWPLLNAEHQRLSHGQALLDAAASAAQQVSEDDTSAARLVGRALAGLEDVSHYDTRLQPVVEALQSVQAQLDDAAHTLNAYLARAEPNPQRLAQLDARLAAWMGLARRFRRPPETLPALLQEWQNALGTLEAAADVQGLERQVRATHQAFLAQAQHASRLRHLAAPPLAARVTAAMQTLGMAGGRFEVALPGLDVPQAFGLEGVEFQVAGHAGSVPRPLAKVASGGELSRLALAIAVTTAQAGAQGGDTRPATLIFDEIDSGVGGTVADTVGQLMQQLGRSTQVLAVTHLPQVAACADHHLLVAKRTLDGQTASDIRAVVGEGRAAEVARMLGGDRASATSLAHARELLAAAARSPAHLPAPAPPVA